MSFQIIKSICVFTNNDMKEYILDIEKKDFPFFNPLSYLFNTKNALQNSYLKKFKNNQIIYENRRLKDPSVNNDYIFNLIQIPFYNINHIHLLTYCVILE